MGEERSTGLEALGKVGVVGLGLIGGSIALDLRQQGVSVTGLVHRDSTAARAMQRGLVDEVSCDSSCLSDCNTVILALPIEALLKPEPQLVEALPVNAVVTDVGSVKGAVLEVWRHRHPRFVATHPMAGTDQSGVDAGLPGLFRGRPWVATPEPSTDPQALASVKVLAEGLGSEWITADAACHDQAVALVSHLPVMVSAALLRAAGDERDPRVQDLARRLASSGFADTTRVGGGNPALGTAMACRNTAALLKALAAYRWSLEQLEEAILSGHWAQLENELHKTSALRPGFVEKGPDPLSSPE
ncbi:Prephenate dehydrogenase [Synechococcus sp. MEDNS5]|uniref:prephenate/arogenate dehydrogenase n=1 Tax=Synechococcus sp. MEDNS5 TaxID=1442554 RepID=UPI0016486D65|nr:prephenate/arogenate dehydrogenase [Synechococcus sp. MEDNS5]QNJ05203.1 Prephenate dehydrogenase [Synechococcus sp. MEDNS5]